MKRTKILLLNLGYCTKLNGSLFDYFTKFYRYPFLSKKVENETLDELASIIKKEKPDLVCIPEIKQGQQVDFLKTNKYEFVNIATKYGEKSPLGKLAFFANRSNAMLAKEDLSFKKHYLKNGTKKLLLEATLPDKTKILLMHFSLNKKTRQKQFLEIQQRFSHIENKIICGDFNIFKGECELEKLLELSKLKLASNKNTFPAFKPKKALDLFLVPKNKDCSVSILKNQLSDHLPVVLEIR